VNERDWCEYVYWVYGLKSNDIEELRKYDRPKVEQGSIGRRKKTDAVVEELKQGEFGVQDKRSGN
jgi:hypothetical protein